MGKKKKKSGAGGEAAAVEGGSNTPAAASSSSAAPAPAAASAAPIPAVTQPWASNYDAMRVWPIVADPHLVLADDSLAKKVNLQQQSAAAAASAASAPAVPRFQFGIYTSRADDAGRRAIAHGPIAAGTLLLRERGSPWIAHAAHADKVCHACAKCLYDPKFPAPPVPAAGEPKPASRHLHCAECDGAFYCSAACQSAHLRVHSLECPVLQQADDISDLAKCNVDLVRAAVKYVVGKAIEAGADTAAGAGDAAASSLSSSSSAAAPTVFDPFHFQSSASDSDLLVDHLSTVSPTDLRNMRDASALILKALPPAFANALPHSASQSPADSIAAFMNRLNSNCHGLHLEDHPTIQFGFGLYPLCAIFNHSCYPNCVFVNEGADLAFRVIRAVEPHEELTVNYISLYAARPQRRKELWQTKKFFCQCRRCNLRPKNEEEKQKFALDGIIGAVACQKAAAAGAAASSSSSSASVAKCPGSYRINYAMRDAKAEAERARLRKEARKLKQAAAAAAAAAAAPSAAASSSSSSAASAGPVDAEIDTSRPNESTSVSVSEQKDDGAASAAAAPKTVDAADVSEESEDDDDDDEDESSPDEFPLLLRPKVTSARCTHCGHTGNREALHDIQLRALEHSEHLLSVYASGSKSPAQLREAFEAFYTEQSQLLHPSHAVLFNLLLPLVNISSALKDWKRKAEYCRRVVAMAEAVFPIYFLPLANYYEALANCEVQCIKQGIGDGVPRKLLQRHRDDAAAVLDKMAKQIAICRGPDHPRTADAMRKAADTRKIKITA